MSPGRFVLGIDLSGPSNHAETALVWFEETRRGLRYVDALAGASDAAIVETARGLEPSGGLVVGIDAPLSYADGGGDRPSDAALRARLVAIGMRPGSVMTPTMTRMSYLTLRGVSVARALGIVGVDAKRIVEVHPGGAFALHGAAVSDVMTFKADVAARRRLLEWLGGQGVRGLPGELDREDHLVAACGAAYGAWKWRSGESVWRVAAVGPLHPFEFAC